MGVSDFPIYFQTKLILMALVALIIIITIIIYTPFVRLMRNTFRKQTRKMRASVGPDYLEVRIYLYAILFIILRK